MYRWYSVGQLELVRKCAKGRDAWKLFFLNKKEISKDNTPLFFYCLNMMLHEDVVLILKMWVKMVSKEWDRKRMGLVLWVYLLASIDPPGLPRWCSGKESACQCRRCGFSPWVWKILWSRKWHPTPVFLTGKFHEQRSLVGYSPWSHRVRYHWASEDTCINSNVALHWDFFC